MRKLSEKDKQLSELKREIAELKGVSKKLVIKRQPQHCIVCGDEIIEAKYADGNLKYLFCSTKCTVEHAGKLNAPS